MRIVEIMRSTLIKPKISRRDRGDRRDPRWDEPSDFYSDLANRMDDTQDDMTPEDDSLSDLESDSDWYQELPVKDELHSIDPDDFSVGGLFFRGFNIGEREFKLLQRSPEWANNEGKLLYYGYTRSLAGENPWVPVVYDIDIVSKAVYLYRLGKKQPAVMADYKMERLLRWSQVPARILFHSMLPLYRFFRDNNLMLLQQFSDYHYEQMVDDWQQWEAGTPPDDMRFHMGRMIDDIVKTIVDIVNQSVDVKLVAEHDPELVAVCDIIRNIIRKHGLHLDLHTGNVLFRPTQYGVQMVINDPVAQVTNYRL